MKLIKIFCCLQLVLVDVIGDGDGLDKDSMQSGAGRADVSSATEGLGAFQTISNC